MMEERHVTEQQLFSSQPTGTASSGCLFPTSDVPDITKSLVIFCRSCLYKLGPTARVMISPVSIDEKQAVFTGVAFMKHTCGKSASLLAYTGHKSSHDKAPSHDAHHLQLNRGIAVGRRPE